MLKPIAAAALFALLIANAEAEEITAANNVNCSQIAVVSYKTAVEFYNNIDSLAKDAVETGKNSIFYDPNHPEQFAELAASLKKIYQSGYDSAKASLKYCQDKFSAK